MKVEHKLSPTTAAYVREALEALNQKRREYLAALGAAKEVEMAAETLRAALSQQLAIEEAAARLPKSIAPYALSADGAALIGETADPPAPPPAIVEPPAIEPPAEHVNGVSRE